MRGAGAREMGTGQGESGFPVAAYEGGPAEAAISEPRRTCPWASPGEEAERGVQARHAPEASSMRRRAAARGDARVVHGLLFQGAGVVRSAGARGCGR